MAHSSDRKQYIAYYRVSTRKQGRSGLGLDAQREAVNAHIARDGGSLLREFVETESGKRTDRPQLSAALASCRLTRATLIVAKLDRLARNAAFLLSLRDSGAELMAVDLPSMNRMTVGILAVVAEEEARLISERTRSALAAARKRGVTLGNPGNLTDGHRALGAAASSRVRAQMAQARAADLAPIVAEVRARGATSLRQIAAELDRRAIPAARGGNWRPSAVAKLLTLVDGGVRWNLS
jgi:DNA invertase Pin-like site-specific DNA recombinase